MEEQKAQSITQTNGSTLIKYQSGYFAHLVLPSNEKIIISVGSTTVKVFTRRSVIGWIFPKTVASRKIEYWVSLKNEVIATDHNIKLRSFSSYNQMERFGCGIWALDGLVVLLSSCKSILEIKLAWPELANPLQEGIKFSY